MHPINSEFNTSEIPDYNFYKNPKVLILYIKNIQYMNTKLLMIASAIFCGVIGIGMTFLSAEIAEYLGTEINEISSLIFQILGAVYLGFGMLNWMTKNNLIGGIYSRPLVIGNLVHFLVSSLALLKMVGVTENNFRIILVLTVMYSLFTLFFGYLFMVNPSKISK